MGRDVVAKGKPTAERGPAVAEGKHVAEGRAVCQGDLASGYEAARSGLAALAIRRDTVRVSGPDAERYLQGQLSQDVAGLEPGGWAWSLLLQPQGKLDALLRCYRVSSDEFLLVGDAGVGAHVVERLLRFKLRTKADVELLDWGAVALLGPGASKALASWEGLPSGAQVAVPFEWGRLEWGGHQASPGHQTGHQASPGHQTGPGSQGHGTRAGSPGGPDAPSSLLGCDLLGPSPVPPPEALLVAEEAYEAVRVEAGLPRHGAELDERTVPAEAGLVGAAVSFTKGCYTGQELVARIDSRGSNVPRRLRGLLLTGPAEVGAALFPEVPGVAGAGQRQETGAGEGHKQAGRLTSVAFSPRFGWVGLGYVGRAVGPGERLAVGEPSSAVTALVSELPLAPR